MKSAWLYTTAILLQLCSAIFRVHDASFDPDYVLNVTAKDVTVDCNIRYSVVVNGSWPGPTLYLKEEKTTWVRVYNNIAGENLTMHWHGLTMRVAPFSDGTPLVSQWPIKTGEYFDYELHPDTGDAGTYFYHSHVGFQAATANGALIVNDSDANPVPYVYDEEKIIPIGDFFAKNDSTIEHGLLANPFVWSGEPDALLFAGKSGRFPFDPTTGDDSCQPYVLSVEPNKTYRMRFIGGTAMSLVTLGFEDHEELTVIEADGGYTKPVVTDHLQLGSGQRFSVLFTTKTEEEIEAAGNKTQYWILLESRDRPINVTGHALLQYVMPGSSPPALPAELPSISPVILSNSVEYWLEQQLSPYDDNLAKTFPPLESVTRTVTITLAQEINNGTYINNKINGTLQWAQNQLIWQEHIRASEDDPPYLVSLYQNGQGPNYTAAVNNQGWDPKSKTFPALVGETLDIVWLSNSGPTGGFDAHPMHAHGKHYWDLGSGNGTYDARANEDRMLAANYTPAIRDTTMLYRYAVKGAAFHTAGWRAWRIKVTEENVGAWMMHCHILQHMVMGMQSVWVFGNASQILSKFPAQPYVNGYLEFGGSAYGNATFDPLVNEEFGIA